MITVNNTELVKNELDRFKEYVLEKVGVLVEGEAVKEMKNPVLHRGGRWFPTYDTGNLANSITHEVDGEVVRVGTPVEYGIYIEKGAKAHWTSVKNLIEWVKRKFSGATEKEQKSIAYAIQHKMSKEDMPPMPFLEPAVWNNMDKIKKIFGGKDFDWKVTAAEKE